MKDLLRYILLLALPGAFLLSCEREISIAQADHFIKFYGSYSGNHPGELKLLSDGGYAVCATVNPDGTSEKMCLLVCDEYGNLKEGFPRYYPEGEGEAGALSLIALNGGSDGYLLSGYTSISSGNTASQDDIFLVRTNSVGEVLWQQQYGGTENEQVLHAIEMHQSGFLLAGYQEKNGKPDLMIMAVTAEGDSIPLGLNYDNPHAEYAVATYLEKSGDYYLSTYTLANASAGGTKVHVLAFDDELSPFDLAIPSDGSQYATCLLQDTDERALVLLNQNNAGGRSTMLINSFATDGIFLSDPEILATISDPEADLTGSRMLKTADGRYVLTGSREDENGSQVFLYFLDPLSTGPVQVLPGGGNGTMGQDLVQTGSDGFLLLGKNTTGDSDALTLIKTGNEGELE